jgi:hypothetical protein
MKYYRTLLFLFLFSLECIAQPVQFNLTNKAAISLNGIDTLKYPYVGGFNSPQFYKMELDGDGVKDLFVFDRIGNKVMTFLYKSGKYVYEPSFETQFPPLFNWVVIKDYNKDGKDDIFSEVDVNFMPEPNEPINTSGIRLIENISTVPGKFVWRQRKNEILDMGVLQLPPSRIGIAVDDIPGIEDIDNDGDLDLLFMRSGLNVISYYQNLSQERGYGNDSILFLLRDDCWGYTSYLMHTNAFLLADKSSCFRNYKRSMHNGTSLNFIDMDNDGDKDLIYGDNFFNGLVYLENGKALNSKGRDSIISQDTLFPKNTTRASLEVYPASFYLDVDNDGKKDMLVATCHNELGKNKDQVMYYKNTGTALKPVFTYQNSPFLTNEMFDLGGNSIPTLVDIDSDGDLDMVLSTQGEYTQTYNANDRLVLLLNVGNKNKASYVLEDNDFLKINEFNPRIMRAIASFGDLNGDGKPDMVIGDLYGKIHYYENSTVGSQIKFTKKSSDYYSMYAGRTAAPQLFDLNKDGVLDLVVGARGGNIAYFENKGTVTNAIFSSSPSIDSVGKISVAEQIISAGQPFVFDGYARPHVCDLDNDGRFEILVGSFSGRVFLYRNFEANATRVCDEVTEIFSEGAGITPSNVQFGVKSSVTSGDLDGDGLNEVLIGNDRGGLRMYSTQVKGVISGIKEQAKSAQNWVLYPNPAQSIISVRTDKNMSNQSYEIYDLVGKMVGNGKMEGYETRINILGLGEGIYLLKSTDREGNVYVSRFLVED